MKKVIVSFAILFLGIFTSNAQLLKFGIKGGANFATLEGQEFDTDNLMSFHAGALLEVSVFENFSIQPEFLYSSQGTKINEEDLKLDYVSVPVLAKFYLTSKKLSLEVGPQFSFLLSQNVPDTFRTKSYDFAAAGGLGYNITNSFFVQARYIVGLTDAERDATITNRVIQVSAGLRF